MPDRKRIGEVLVDLRVLTEPEVERVLLAMRRRGGSPKFGHVAREMGLLREEHVLAALTVQMQLLPHADRMTLSGLLDCLCDPNYESGKPPPRRPRRTAAR